MGGADFLRIQMLLSGSGIYPDHLIYLTRVRSSYYDQAPNLTKVVYSGISGDGKILSKITSQLGRTDDLVRNYYHLEYEFLEGVEYERLAFFQVAADNYSDNGFQKFAYGNENEVIRESAITNHKIWVRK